MMPRSRPFVAALFWLVLGIPLQAEEIKPPFSLTWGETSARMEKLLANTKGKIVARRTTQTGLEAWDVDGLVQNGLKRTIFYFRNKKLAEVELQYRADEWDQKKYDELMGDIRKAIQRRYGEGDQIARKNEPNGEVMQTIVGYKWNQNNAAIELFYYSAQNGQNIFRTISVHYKTS